MKFNADAIEFFQFVADVGVQIRIDFPQTAAWTAVAYCQESFSWMNVHPDGVNLVSSDNVAQSGSICSVYLGKSLFNGCPFSEVLWNLACGWSKENASDIFWIVFTSI